ncbi:MAG: DNA-directed RNA polymerase subunit omega [Planctomycetaceae bacterium]|jgi:DNA-directed RNA polymerase subunit omega|nr:DNA-directed RNA polymerase subunit omega [Planctomycetaceae bacterium]
MIEELKDEELIKKVGGRFKLSSLIQKRLVYLNKGAQSFVDTEKSSSRNKLHVVIREILQDKIYLDMEGNLHERQPSGVDIVFDSEYTEI